MAKTYEIPTATGYKTVTANSKAEALSSLTASGVTPTLKTAPPMTTNAGISSSAPIRVEENKLKTDIDNAYNSIDPKNADVSGALTDLGKQEQDFIKERMDAIERMGEANVKGINEAADSNIAGVQGEQVREKGTFNVGLARIGGYLGGSASSMGAINNLEKQHRVEIATLESKRQAAIQAAKNATAEQAYALAKDYMKSVRDTESEIQKRKDTFFNQTLQYTQNQRQNQEFVAKQANDELDMLVTAGKEPTTDDVMTLAGRLNTSPDTIMSVIKAKQESQALKLQGEKTDQEIKILSVLDGLPKGTFVTIGGKVYEGMKSSTTDPSVIKKNEFGIARQFISDNPDATENELSSYLRENTTSLTDGDISTLLKSAGPRGGMINTIATAVVKKGYASTWMNFDSTDLEEAKEASKKKIDAASQIEGNDLTVDAKTKIKAAIDGLTLNDIK